jgi:NADH:ubiquinone oxidoreductase subunit E
MLTLPAEIAADNADVIALIDTLVERHGSDRSALIPVLQDLREQRREISDVAMQVVADRLGVTPTAVYGVVTFYAFLGTGLTGRHVVRLCRTLSCEMAGVRQIAQQLESELGVPFGGTTADGAVTLEWANCIGMCDQAPAALVDVEAVGSLSRERVTEIVAGLEAAGSDV